MFEEQYMNLELIGITQKEVLMHLSELAFQNGLVTNTTDLVHDYLEREAEATTGFGNGVAIPHTRSKTVLKPGILFARTIHPIEWQSLDGSKVDTIISLLIPEESNQEHLKLLATFSRNLIHKGFVHVLKTGSKEEVYQLIKKTIGE